MNNIFNNTVLIKIHIKDQTTFLNYTNKNNISINKISSQHNELIIETKYKDLNKIKKYTKYEIIKYYGIREVLNNIYIFLLKYLYIIVFIISSIFISQFVVEIKIIHNNPDIRELINKELILNGIYKNSISKSYDELNEIKKNIILNNKDVLEWLEIEKTGMKYTVKVQEKIYKPENKKKNSCNIVAKKDGIIKSIKASKGEVLVEENQYVSKDEILISGEIKYNNEIKQNTCATGTVTAKTWYKIDFNIDKEYLKYTKTGKKRFNISINNKELFNNRLIDFKKKEKNIIKLFNNQLNWIIDYEVEEQKKEYTNEEITEKINKEIENKLSDLIKGKFKIIQKNILKKEEKKSIINIEVFVVVEEEISTQIETYNEGYYGSESINVNNK